MALNKLSLNCEKTKAMIFHTKQRTIEYPEILINNHLIEFVEEFNFLGIVLDKHLNWKPHASFISNKISKTLGIMNKLKNVLLTEALLHIYNSLILSHINYGLFLWGARSKQVTKLLKRAIRIISGSKYNAHTSVLFKKLKLLKFEQLCTLHDYKICYKLFNSLLPISLSSAISPMEQLQTRYATRYRNQLNLPLYRVRHEYAKQMFKYRIPQIFNNMEELIKNKLFSHSYIGFKLYIKNRFIGGYSADCNIIDCYICLQH